MNPALSNPRLTQDVVAKRCLAFFCDAFVIGAICLFLSVFFGVFGFLTIGLGWHLFALLPLVPFCYHCFTLAQFGATFGQRFMGLCVRDVRSLAPPSLAQAVISTLCFYATLATSGILLLVTLVTDGSRALHDLAAGLIVVRADTLMDPIIHE